MLTLSRMSKRSSYDCEYVSLAIRLDVTMVSNGKHVLSAFPKTAMAPVAFLAG